MNESNIQLYQELRDLPQSIINTVDKLPEEMQDEFKILYHQRKKTTLGALFFHTFVVGSSFGYTNNWVLQFIFWLTLFGFGIGWLLTIPVLPFLVRKENKRIARKTLTEVLVKHNYSLNNTNRSVKNKSNQPKNIQKNVDFDPSKITIDQLKVKDLFDFNLKTWTIISEAQFDFSNAESERCLHLVSGIEIAYVYWQRIGQHLQLAFAKAENLFKLDADILRKMDEDKVPPNILTYKEKEYFRATGKQGLFFIHDADAHLTKSERCKLWIYWDDSREQFIRLEQIGKNQLMAYVGRLEMEERFTDLLPFSID